MSLFPLMSLSSLHLPIASLPTPELVYLMNSFLSLIKPYVGMCVFMIF